MGLVNIYLALLSCVLVFRFTMGVAIWVMAAPLVGTVVGGGYVTAMGAIICLAYIFHVVQARSTSVDKCFGLSLVLLLALSIWSTLITGYYEYVHVLFVYAVAFGVSYIIMVFGSKSRSNLVLIAGSFIAAGVIASLVAFGGDGGGTRLALGENVRRLANACGMALVILVSVFIYPGDYDATDGIIRRSNIVFRFRWVIAAVLAVGVIGSMSRGVLLAIAVSVAIPFAAAAYRHFRRTHFWRLCFLLSVSIAVTYVISIYSVSLSEFAGLDINRFMTRFADSSIDDGASIRRDIWRAAISEMSVWNMVFGSGASSFRELAILGGYDYYAHSVFVDSFVVVGAVGFIVLIILLAYVFVKAMSYKEVGAISVFTYVVMSHLTHGTLSAMSFWYSMAISYALVLLRKRAIVSRERPCF